MFDKNKFTINKDKIPKAASSDVQIRKPKSDEVIQTHASWRLDGVAVLPCSNGSFFLVAEDLVDELKEHIEYADLVATVSTKGELFLWPVLSKQRTACECAVKAQDAWHEFGWVAKKREYEVVAKKDVKLTPAWRYDDFDRLLEEALTGRTIEDRENELFKKAREKSKGKAE